MGFFVEEKIDFPQLGINIANCYVTIRATFSHMKRNFPIPGFTPITYDNSGNYTLVAKYYIYSGNSLELNPLKEDFIAVTVDALPADPVTALYDAIKTQHFAGKTITDDL